MGGTAQNRDELRSVAEGHAGVGGAPRGTRRSREKRPDFERCAPGAALAEWPRTNREPPKTMDLQSRFAIFTAVGVASFSAGLSLTTACSNRLEPEPEKITIHPSLPTEPARPATPVRDVAMQKPS